MKLIDRVAGVATGMALGLFGSSPADAGCISNPRAQSSASFPASLTGKLLYHSYVDYGDGTSRIYLYDVSARTLTRLSQPSWGITDPMTRCSAPTASG